MNLDATTARTDQRRAGTATVIDLRAQNTVALRTGSPKNPRITDRATVPDFASRTRFVRRPSTESIPGLPSGSDAYADGSGALIADIIAATPPPAAPSWEPTTSPAGVGVSLPPHTAALTVEVRSGRITAGSLIAALEWAEGHELWATETSNGYWELVTQKPSRALSLQARVMTRGRTQLAADTRTAIGLEDGQTVLAIATTQNTLALIPLQALTLRSTT